MKVSSLFFLSSLIATTLAQDGDVPCGACDDLTADPGNVIVSCYCNGPNIYALGVENAVYTARVGLADYQDATGLLPDGSTYSQAQAFTSSVSTTVTTGLNLEVGFARDVVNAAASASLSVSVTTTQSTTNTETVEITIDCGGRMGRIQYQPLYLAIEGNLVRILDCAASDCFRTELIGPGVYHAPQVGSNEFQLVNFRQQCDGE